MAGNVPLPSTRFFRLAIEIQITVYTCGLYDPFSPFDNPDWTISKTNIWRNTLLWRHVNLPCSSELGQWFNTCSDGEALGFQIYSVYRSFFSPTTCLYWHSYWGYHMMHWTWILPPFHQGDWMLYSSSWNCLLPLQQVQAFTLYSETLDVASILTSAVYTYFLLFLFYVLPLVFSFWTASHIHSLSIAFL